MSGVTGISCKHYRSRDEKLHQLGSKIILCGFYILYDSMSVAMCENYKKCGIEDSTLSIGDFNWRKSQDFKVFRCIVLILWYIYMH